MSRIEEALENAVRLRNLKEAVETGHAPAGRDLAEAGINVLIISEDNRLSGLIHHLQSILHGDIIAATDVIQGMKFFFADNPMAIDEYELKFTAMMLDDLCCYTLNCQDAK